MSPEQLLAAHKGGRRRTLEQLIAKHSQLNLEQGQEATLLSEFRKKTKWFLDQARIKISVSIKPRRVEVCQPRWMSKWLSNEVILFLVSLPPV